MRGSRVAQLALGSAATLWTVLLFAAPGALFPAGTLICHQRPERSFFLHGHQLPVCARCTGLYVGAALAAPLAIALAAAIASRRSRWIVGLAALPTLVTWTLEFTGVMPFSNLSRCAAALPLGFAAAWIVLGEVGGVVPGRPSSSSPASATAPRA